MTQNPWPPQQPAHRYQTGPVRPPQRRSDGGCLGALAGFFLGWLAIGWVAYEAMVAAWGETPGPFGDVEKQFYAAVIGFVGGAVTAALLGARRR